MLKYIFFVLFFILSIFPSVAQDKYRVKADKLNVRSSNDPKSKIVGYVPENEIVIVINNSDPKFVKIKVRNGEGWVSREFLELAQKAKPAPTSPANTSLNNSKETNNTSTPISNNNSNNESLDSNTQNLNINNQNVPQEKDTTQWVFIGLIVMVVGLLIFVIFKFVHNKFYKAFAFIIVLLFSYTIYQGFVVEKTVGGKYQSLANHQFASFEFKPNGDVLIYDQYLDTTYRSTYKIEGSKVLFKQDENLFIMIIKDQNTLLGEGFLKGQYIK
ncbi:MAG: SH3 domain-containing protein [Pedobacter sp.]|nr:MAG: SH3 domain-containing protein [Pedobacter sp.]